MNEHDPATLEELALLEAVHKTFSTHANTLGISPTSTDPNTALSTLVLEGYNVLTGATTTLTRSLAQDTGETALLALLPLEGTSEGGEVSEISERGCFFITSKGEKKRSSELRLTFLHFVLDNTIWSSHDSEASAKSLSDLTRKSKKLVQDKIANSQQPDTTENC